MIYPSATVACFDPTKGELPRRQLDRDRVIAFLQRLGQSGAESVLIAASTGQGHLRTREELEEYFEVASRASMSGTSKMALVRPEDGIEFNRRLIPRLKGWGYDVVFVRPGNNLEANASDQTVAKNLLPIVECCDEHAVPLGLYSISDVSGVPLTPGAAAKLVKGPGGDVIVAIKVTEADYESSTLSFLSNDALAHLTIVQGWDPHLARALRDGPRYSRNATQRCGVTSGAMSFCLFQYLHILDSASKEDWAEVEEAQWAVTALFVSMQDDPNQFADLQRAKYIMGLGHPVLSEVTEDQVERVFQALTDLPRPSDRSRIAKSLNLMGDGPFRQRLNSLQSNEP